MKFLPCSPDQIELLPPSVPVVGEGHLRFCNSSGTSADLAGQIFRDRLPYGG